jgi:hypothetical protein
MFILYNTKENKIIYICNDQLSALGYLIPRLESRTIRMEDCIIVSEQKFLLIFFKNGQQQIDDYMNSLLGLNSGSTTL